MKPRLGEREIPYIAGYFDADGFITIGRRFPHDQRVPRFIPVTGLGNTDHSIVKQLHRVFGGTLLSRVTSGNRVLLLWRCHDRRAVEFLRTIFSFLRTKRKQAELLFDFVDGYGKRDTKDRRRLAESELQRREKIRHKIMQLNQARGKIRERYRRHGDIYIRS